MELKEVAKTEPVVVLPIGSVEDHGPHLPLDVDNFLIWRICGEAARRVEGGILLMPIIPHGFETHHMDFPGTTDIGMEHLLHFVLDVAKSVAHHGFRRILIADGHGSNMPILELVAKRTILETDALCAAFLWPSHALSEIRGVRESGRGGMSHRSAPVRCFLQDLTDPGPIRMMDYWTGFSKGGSTETRLWRPRRKEELSSSRM